MSGPALKQHVYSTYTTLRHGMYVMAFAFPLLLLAIGNLIYGIPLADSMSNYYFELPPSDATQKVFPMRIWFVGLLFAIGSALYLYKGFSKRENILLNIAGVCAVGVALVPMNHRDFPADAAFSLLPSIMHGVFAISLFLCIAYVSIFCAKETVPHLNNPELEKSYRKKYNYCAAFMIASPLTALIFSFLAEDIKKYTYFVEFAGIWAFAYYWRVKSTELAISCADLKILKDHVMPADDGLPPTESIK